MATDYLEHPPYSSSIQCRLQKIYFLSLWEWTKIWGLFVAHKNTYQENPTIEDVLKN